MRPIFKKYLLLLLAIISLNTIQAQSERWENFEPPCCLSSGSNFISVLTMGDVYIKNVHITDPNDIILQSTGANALPAGAISGHEIDICHPDIDPGKIYDLTIISSSQAYFLIFPAFSTEEGANVELNAGTEICSGEMIYLDNFVNTSDASYSTAGDITWSITSGSGNLNTSDNTYTANFSGPALTETVTLTATAGTGACQDSETLNIIVNKVGDASWTPSKTSYCLNEASEIFSTTGDTGPNAAFSISPAGPLTNNGSNATFNPNQIGNYMVTYTVGYNGSGSCVSTVDHAISVVDNADASVRDSSTCGSNPIQLTNLIAGDAGGTFVMHDNSGSGGSINALFAYTPGGVGTDSIMYIVGDTNTCGDYQILGIDVGAGPVAQWKDTATYVFCSYESITLDMLTRGYATNFGANTVSFSDNNGYVSNNDLDLSAIPACNGGTDITFDITMTVDNGSGCTTTNDSTFTIICIDPSWTPPGPVCVNGLPVDLENSSTNIASTGGTFTNANVINNTFDPASAGAGTHQITYTVIENGCTDLQIQDIIVVDTANIAYTVDIIKGCAPLEVSFDASSSTAPTGGTLSYDWNLTSTTSSDVAPSHTYDAGTFNNTLKVINNEQGIACSTTTNITPITVIPAPFANGTVDPSLIIAGTQVTFNNTSTISNPAGYYWDLDDGNGLYPVTNQSSQTNNSYEVGNYQAQLKVFYLDSDIIFDPNCRDSILLDFRVTSEVIVHFPNAFTPGNSDGLNLNDTFGPLGFFGSAVSYEFNIYNRYGDNVFTSDSHTKKWDGNMPSGDPALNGVYTYILNITDDMGEKIIVKGTVLLMR